MPTAPPGDRENKMVTARSYSITVQQRQWIRVYVANGGDGVAAAHLAGYADPEDAAFNLIRNRTVFLALQYEIERDVIEGCILGTARLHQIINRDADSATDRATQVQAVKALYARAESLRERHERHEQSEGGNMEGMSKSALQELQRDMEELKRREAEIVDITPSDGSATKG